MRAGCLVTFVFACGGGHAGSPDARPIDAPDSEPPSVAIAHLSNSGQGCMTSASCDCYAHAGDTLTFDIVASDVGGVASTAYSATFATSAASPVVSMMQPLAPAQPSVTQSSTLQIPTDVATETAILSASATSAADVMASAPTLRLCVLPAQAALAPVVAWEDTVAGTSQIYLKQWTGTAWQELGGSATAGGISNAGFSASSAAVALMPDGKPVVAWVQRTAATYGNLEIYVKQWTGSAWQELAGSATAGGLSQSGTGNFSLSPSVAVDAQGRIYVAWQWFSSTSYVYVKRWTGTAWEELAASATGNGVSGPEGSAPVIRLDGAGGAVVAWNDEVSNGCAIWAKRWNGTAWEELAGSATGNGISAGTSMADPAMDIDLDGEPFVVWSGAGDFGATRWDGTQWLQLGGTAPGGGGCTAGARISVTIDYYGHPNVALLAYSPAPTHLLRYDGATWHELMPASGASGTPQLARYGNLMLAAWYQTVGGQAEIYLRAWNGSAWQELGGSATAGGLSATPGDSYDPAIATR